MCIILMYMFFFFKQETAYEMRISDWSSDVCSSDRPRHHAAGHRPAEREPAEIAPRHRRHRPCRRAGGQDSMSLGSKVIVKLFHVSYFSGGRLRGVQDGLRRARSADSAAALKNGSDIRAASTIWASRTVRSGFMRTRISTSSEAPSLAPAGTSQQRWIC